MTVQDLRYFDNNATTRIAPEVLDAMLPFLTEHWANPSSPYTPAQRVAKAVEQARGQVAALINAEPRDVLFTSCGTESNNAAIQSALALDRARRHVVMTAVEHSANLKFGEFLSRSGYEVTFLSVNEDGALDLRELDRSVRPDTAIVSVMWANNETGVLFPIPEIAALCRNKNVLVHTDAVQAVGKVPVDVRAAGVDMLSLSGHKLYAPKGIGALYVRRGLRFQPLLIGGQQERGRRAGTENVPALVGFGRAAELAVSRLTEETVRIRGLRDELESGILGLIPRTRRNGAAEPRLPNTTNIAFEGVESEAVLIKLDQLGICASSGSACRTGSLEASHVLKAMGLSAALARASIRFSLGHFNTSQDVRYLLDHLPAIIGRLRAMFEEGPSVPAGRS